MTVRWTLLLALVSLVAAGCNTTRVVDPADFAKVNIEWNTPRQIAEVTRQVFKEHGFTANQPGLLPLSFEKNASRANNAAYGNWIGDKPLRVRAKVHLVPVTEGTYRLQCTACLVRDSGGTTEEEIGLSRQLHAGTYQDILEEIATRVKALPKPGV